MNIGYHTRRDDNNAVRVVGGSFRGGIDAATVNRLVDSQFTVAVKNSGRPVFVDTSGREVQLYLAVDAAKTEKGKAALQAWHSERAAQQQREEAQSEAEAEEVASAMEGLSHEEIVKRLRSPSQGT